MRTLAILVCEHLLGIYSSSVTRENEGARSGSLQPFGSHHAISDL